MKNQLYLLYMLKPSYNITLEEIQKLRLSPEINMSNITEELKFIEFEENDENWNFGKDVEKMKIAFKASQISPEDIDLDNLILPI